MLTKRQKQILDFITGFIKDKGYSPTHEEIRRHFRLKSVATVHEHIETLRSKDYLKKEPNQPRGIEPYSSKRGFVEIPLLGYIAAGEPIEAISNPEPIAVPQKMVSSSGLHYALKVKGSSMINENIHDGDVVIIRRQETAENGQKVVALIDNNEVTLKKLYRENGRIRLQPANPDIKPIYIDPSRIVIQGIVMDVIKNDGSLPQISLAEKTKQYISIKTRDIGEFLNQVIEGDCLRVMQEFPDKSIDMILCDLPYGTTQNEWDSQIPLDKLWKIYERIIKDRGVIALTSQGIFTAKLILSNEKLFKYKIVWEKSKPTNFLNAKKQPLRVYEDICIFYKKQPIYNPQMRNGEPYNKGVRKNQLTGSYGVFNPVEVKSNGERYPVDIIYFKTAESEGPIYHPTQKPVEFARYLIRTYTDPEDIVLDNTCGSGSFLVAAVLEGRKFIGIEKNEDVKLHKKEGTDLIEICNRRIREAINLKKQMLL